MKFSTCTLVVAASLSFASCGSLPTGLPGMPGAGGNAAVDQMKDQPVSYMMYVPAGVSVGEWWEVEAYGQTTRSAVVAEVDGNLIIEQTGNDVVQAFAIDPNVDVTDMDVAVGASYPANVVAAWVGAEGDKPMERPVMDAPKRPEDTGTTAAAVAVDYTEGDESVTIAGKTFNAHWMETGDMKVWTENGTGFQIKMAMKGDTTSEITAWGTDAEPSLDWTEGESE